MKHLHILLLFPLLFVVNDIQGQNTYGHADNIVMTQYKFHISFQSGSPVVQHKVNYSRILENYGVYSDKHGNLKIYCGLDTIWNGNHQSIGILNSARNLHEFNITPMPGNPNIVYIFAMHTLGNTGSSAITNYDTLYYSLVDLTGNNGQGSIILNHQQFSDEILDYSIAATKHANGRDYWLVARKHMSNKYVSFHIQPGGVIDTVHSVAGPPTAFDSIDVQSQGLIFSPNGRWLADNTFMTDTLRLLNFNAKTGIVHDSNMIFIPPAGYMLAPWKVSFSPNSTILYVSQWDFYPRLYQYDISSGNQQVVINSKIMIHNSQQAQSTSNGEMALMTNGKIYSYERAGWPGNLNNPYFNEIVNPNNIGLACNWQPHTTVIDSFGRNIKSHFPNFCSSWLQQPVDFSYTHTCAGENAQPTLFAFTDSVYQAEWHFGDSLAGGADTSSSLYPSYSYSQPGQYTLWVKALHYGMWDSIAKTIVIHQNPQIDIGIDTTLIGYDTLVLDPGGGYASYLWNTGDTTQTLTLYGSQMSGGSHNYWVEVTDTNGCSAKAYRTITYSGVGIKEHKQQAWKVFPNPANEQLTIELPKALQEEAVLKLYNQSGAIVRRYEWPGQDKTHRLSLKGLSNGIYWLELDDGTQTLRQKVVRQ